MKFTLAILAIVTAVTAAPVEKTNCDGFCTDEYAPITCSNGVVYGNACRLNNAKCDPRAFDGVTCNAGDVS
ncbi:hypothetical protein LEL_03915 [Akanthomyces lecanii RCEF 1005]|uniref:Kazal-like domain-containing protein n=1 Tax=Akanthomyces lecanii RCEF 1005 TaxID=1081108 RepID=A0A168JH63_CORDF|nr:hypothetical protein LEL_03915 [Akanthomyces lecanii RCEF 1005]